MHTPRLPLSASETYTALHTTALSFLAAQSYTPAPPHMDLPLLRALCSPSFTHSFGHNFAVRQVPALQGVFSLDGFVAHLQGMLARLERWDVEVRAVVVDEVQGTVVCRVGYWMVAKSGEGPGKGRGSRDVSVDSGEEERGVENDVVWVLEMAAGGAQGEMKVKRSVEFVDAVAAGRLREVMMEVGALGAGKAE
ncbi:hypothetical protein ACN47E_006886 [Coniothyrium glycines]